MSENFGLKIGLEGKKEFKKSLAEINNSFKVLGSEMKLVDSQFDKNNKSTEALTARSEVLNKEIDSQKQKIETLRSALANAAESFGENDRRTQSWQIQLNNAQAALNGMERELNSNNTALANADKGFDEAGDEAKDFSNSVKNAADTSEDADGKLSRLGDTAKKSARLWEPQQPQSGLPALPQEKSCGTWRTMSARRATKSTRPRRKSA